MTTPEGVLLCMAMCAEEFCQYVNVMLLSSLKNNSKVQKRKLLCGHSILVNIKANGQGCRGKAYDKELLQYGRVFGL